MMESGYYWAKWKMSELTVVGIQEEEWEIVEVESDNFVCRCGDDEVWDISYFEFGDKIKKPS